LLSKKQKKLKKSALSGKRLQIIGSAKKGKSTVCLQMNLF